MNNEVSKRLAI